jgi:hypothetical protein
MNITGISGIDSVNGIIIGGEFFCGRLFYEDRPQGPMIYGDNDSEIRTQASQYLAKLKTDCNEAFRYIYPNNSWTVKFYD